jgi:hypothetical protein
VRSRERGDEPGMELLAAPVMRGGRYGLGPVYFSDVVVRAGHAARTFDDLAGARFAFNERTSHSGYGVVRHALAERGYTTGFFSSMVESGAHQRSLRLITGGEVDASAIDSTVLETEFLRTPKLRQQLKVVSTLGPSPIPPWSSHAHCAHRCATVCATPCSVCTATHVAPRCSQRPSASVRANRGLGLRSNPDDGHDGCSDHSVSQSPESTMAIGTGRPSAPDQLWCNRGLVDHETRTAGAALSAAPLCIMNNRVNAMFGEIVRFAKAGVRSRAEACLWHLPTQRSYSGRGRRRSAADSCSGAVACSRWRVNADVLRDPGPAKSGGSSGRNWRGCMRQLRMKRIGLCPRPDHYRICVSW